MAEIGRVTTADELFQVADDGYDCELLHGELQRMSKPGFRHGAGMVVVVEPERCRLVVHRSNTEAQILGEDGILAGGDVVPGFQLPIRELFA